ncbi:MAG: hypothetical protein ACFCU8_09610 [Thermosynechococcaceae cyanobacterium]
MNDEKIIFHAKEQRVFSGILTTFFFGITLLGVFHHEMWRDELHTWLVGQKSESIFNLIYQMRYDGHPSLWYICVYLLTRITSNPVAMQIFHVLVATGTVYLVSTYSRLTRIQATLFAFGYFPFYEYALISRSYALGVFLTFWCCKLMTSRRRNYGAISITLALMSNVSIYTLILALAFLVGLTIEVLAWERSVFNRGEPNGYRWGESITVLKKDFMRCYAYLAVVVMSMLLSVAQMQFLAPEDRANIEIWNFHFDIERVFLLFENIYKAFIPIPALTYHFWKGYVIGHVGQVPLGIVLLTISIFFLIRTPIPLLIYLSGLGTISFFTYTKFAGSTRHHGHIFILFMACFWLSQYYAQSFKRFDFHWLRRKTTKSRLICGLLCLNFLGGIYAFQMDWRYPFSTAKAAAQFIQAYPTENLMLAGYQDWSAASIAGYLGRDIYYPNQNRSWTFVLWDNKRRRITQDQAIKVIEQQVDQQHKRALVILNSPVMRLSQFPRLSPLRFFEGSIVRDENTYLYLLDPKV